ncbi:MAG: anthranilate synthase component I [Elusimicrobia bacterium]|jgi:anthranilate synthase component 1|nr:anthranilate synthase component I [Elusimicrobiota bacterium]
MIYPSLTEFKSLARKHSLVPVWVECPGDEVTPLALFHALYAQSPQCFLLESVEGGEHLGRYSFAAFEPSVVLRSKTVTSPIPTPQGVGPLEALRVALAHRRAPEVRGLPRFYGGAVGFTSYDILRHFERLPSRTKDVLGVPDFVFMLTGDMFIFDHVAHTIRLVRTVAIPRGASAEKIHRRAGRELVEKLSRLRPTPAPLTPLARAERKPLAYSLEDRRRFESGVRLAKKYINAGDIIQVVPSRRVTRQVKAHPLEIYRALRRVNPSPYMYFFRDGETHVIGSSPEMLVRLDDGVAETRPIAGTRPRGTTPEADDRLAQQLLADPKERAEHLMLVDLARNDLGRVSRNGSVRVSDFMGIERYSHVMHIVSKVTSRLLPHHDAFDLFRAVFPAGTLSGAPKIRATEIIEELESTRRGLYGGAVGYFSYTGNMDMAIAIRTILMQKNRVHLQAGAGIVADSVPVKEFDETQSKMAALVAALRLAGEKI